MRRLVRFCAITPIATACPGWRKGRCPSSGASARLSEEVSEQGFEIFGEGGREWNRGGTVAAHQGAVSFLFWIKNDPRQAGVTRSFRAPIVRCRAPNVDA